MTDTVRIFGYQSCNRCRAIVLNEVAWKTGGLCSECFRVGPTMETIIAVTKDRERVVLKLDRRSPGERAQRRRAKTRKRTGGREHNRVTMLARSRALARLSRVFPEIFEVILADERAKLGLEAWTIERTLTPHRVTDETMDLLVKYHALDQKAKRC